MNRKWYRSNFVKSVWIVLEHVAAALAALCAAVIIGLYQDGVTLEDRGNSYVESKQFEKDIYSYSESILNQLKKKILFTGQQGESAKVIDLQEIVEKASFSYDSSTSEAYYSLGSFTYENISGLAYTAEDLKKWAADSWEYSDFDKDSNVLICENPAGTTMYCYYNDFVRMLEDGELILVTDDKYMSQTGEDKETVVKQFLELLEYGNLAEGGITDWGIKSVEDSHGNVQYLDIWNYTGGTIAERYTPVGESSILDVVNKNPMWKGRLEEAYNALNIALEMVSDSIEAEMVLGYYEEDETNLTYLYADEDNQRIYSNKESYENYEYLDSSLKVMMSEGAYIIIRPQLSDCETNFKSLDSWNTTGQRHNTRMQNWNQMVSGLSSGKNFVFAVQIDTRFPAADGISESSYYYDRYAKWIVPAVMGEITSILILLAGFIWLTIAAGRKPEDEEIHLCAFDRWFTEVAAVMILGAWGIGLKVMFTGFGGAWLDSPPKVCIFVIVVSVFTAAMFFTGYLSLVRRIKARSLWKDSLLRWILRILKKVVRKAGRVLELYSRNTSSKVIITVAVAGFLFLQMVVNGLLFTRTSIFLIILFLMDAAVLLCFLWKADGQDKIMEGLKRISGGELQYKIPLERLRGQQRIMAEYINNIGAGLDAAVENSLKNERMKTELITNVSHDIKTPLTSIINYVGLLKRENFTDPKICGYLDVLEEKALRLKVLTEDVVEASKASTGNISLEMSELDFVEMLHQVIGEFEEKFGEKNLTMMVHFTDEPSTIYADGQRMWRVLENIFNNVVKYAMEGTRVYAEVKKGGNKVIFSLKNISAQPLNISADELTERFIRGDVARNTEGSGLGLSIAKSLTELQGGEFNVYLDGDLFKVIITFAAKQDTK
ncbi:MAG: HAMP domain-containing sensor histidine kinase [Eubacteriales bacterium]|nr:HAMP domain-containing sensor histidine kinase [Eubacteriales bacterium]